MVKAALAVELEQYGKTLADFEEDLLKTAKDKDKDKDEKKEPKGPGRMALPLIGLGAAATKFTANTMAQGAVLAGQTAAKMDEKMENDDKHSNALYARKAVLDKAIQNLKAKHPHLN
jgi:hypothetical protein